jgi:hypothetical protein
MSTSTVVPASPASVSPAPRPAAPTAPAETAAAETERALPDLFDLGRRAAAARDGRWGARASFTRSRQLLASGAWRGPRDAAESYVELADLAALGGFAAAAAAGARLLVGLAGTDAPADAEAHRLATRSGARSIWRVPYRAGEPAPARRARLEALREQLDADGAGTPWGVMPSPVGEPEGLDTLRVVATLRLDLPEIPHLVLDVAALGPRLAQMALGFGGDELWAPIVSERALRLGANANNPAMTRKEATVLIRGAGLRPAERTAPDTYSEEEA